MSSNDKQLYVIPVNNFHIVYLYSKKDGIKFEYLSYKKYKVVNTLYELIKLNVLLKMYVSNRLNENVYSIKENVNIIAKAEKRKSLLELRIFDETIYINDIDASILSTYIERFLQKVNLLGQEETPDYMLK